MASAARSRWILVLVLLVAVVAAWRMRRKPPQYAFAYVGDRSVTLWSTIAQVRQPVATLGYGEKVTVLRRAGDQDEVQTDDGAHGWVDASLLMDPSLWHKGEELLEQTRSLTVQATGRTRNLSNVHIEPGRDTARIYQFGREVPVVVLERKVLPAPAASGSDAGDTDAEKPKQEDWLLVLRADAPTPAGAETVSTEQVSGTTAGSNNSGGFPVAGWVLARFIDLDPPSPIGDYVSSAGLRVVGWEVLNTVTSAGGAKSQYVVAATRGAEGQTCDFTALRVYTWGEARQRYETAYAESDFCGNLPLRVTQTSTGPEFSFGEQGDGLRAYVMKQTIVRRIKSTEVSATNRS